MGKKQKTLVKHLCIKQSALKAAMTIGYIGRLQAIRAMNRRFGKRATYVALKDAREIMRIMGLDVPFA